MSVEQGQDTVSKVVSTMIYGWLTDLNERQMSCDVDPRTGVSYGVGDGALDHDEVMDDDALPVFSPHD